MKEQNRNVTYIFLVFKIFFAETKRAYQYHTVWWLRNGKSKFNKNVLKRYFFEKVD